jgi:hypothetical protein
MKYSLFIHLFFLTSISFAAIKVSNPKELKTAVANAKPGDTILLENKIWTNVVLQVSGKGTKEKPIVIMAENKTELIISSPTNYPLLRYSDVLLTLAEADNELNGPTAENIEYVNQVRRRAYGVSFVGRNINNLTITSGGTSGYSLPSVVTIAGGGATKDAEAAVSVVSSGKITGITLIDGGAGYTSAPTVTISGGTGAVITAAVSNLIDCEL